MPLPTTNEMMLPVLQHIADGRVYRRLNIINMLMEHFSLTEDERRRLSDGVTMERPLEHRGLIERPRTGHYRITSRGLEFLAESAGAGSRGPEKHIAENYEKIRKGLAAELLRQIKDNSSDFFEKLVIDLLVKMGYGGSHEDAQAVGRSGDGGIDGIIKADPLGLNVVYIQAKRWEGNVGAPPVRDFVGALDGEGVQEGIFITTSDFNPAAKEYAERSSKRVILINGSELARYMINHNVGVSIEKTYEIKRVDSDYFAEDTENS